MSWRHHAIFWGKTDRVTANLECIMTMLYLWLLPKCRDFACITMMSEYYYLCQISETSVEYLGHFERWHSPHWLTKIAIIQPYHFSFATSLAALCTGRRTVDIFPLLNLATSYIKCSILFIALHFLGHNRDIMMETLSVFPEPQKTHTTNLLIKQYGHSLHYWP